jgi:hypothetical protein
MPTMPNKQNPQNPHGAENEATSANGNARTDDRPPAPNSGADGGIVGSGFGED